MNTQNNASMTMTTMNDDGSGDIGSNNVEQISKPSTSNLTDFNEGVDNANTSESKKEVVNKSPYKIDFLETGDGEEESNDDNDNKSETKETESKKEDKPERKKRESKSAKYDESEFKEVASTDTTESEYSKIVNGLVNDNILTVDETKEYEDSIDGLKNILQDSVESIKEKTKADFISGLSPKAQRLIELDLQGLDIKQILADEPEGLSFDYNSIDMEDSDNQKELYKDFLKATGNDDDEIDDFIETAEDTGTLAKYAKTAQKYFIKESEKENKLRLQELENVALENKEKSKKEFEDFKNNILNTKEIKGIELSKKKAEDLYNYMAIPVEKSGRSQWMVDAENLDTKKAIAYMMMNKFDFSKIEAKVETRKTIELKKQLSNFTDTNMSSKGTRLIEEDNNTEYKSNKPFWKK